MPRYRFPQPAASEITPEPVWRERRRLLAGLGGLAALPLLPLLALLALLPLLIARPPPQHLHPPLHHWLHATLGAGPLGWLVFAQVPAANTLAGAGIVIASGLYLLYRERVVGRAA